MSNAFTAGIGRHSHGFTPPVKTNGNGHAMPASCPSIETCTSRKAPPPQRPFGPAKSSGWLPNQNSSHEFPLR